MSKQNQKGFSLLEVIIVVFILAIGLVGILSLATMSLRGSSLGRDRLIASGLAQEGIEVIRGMRRSTEEWSDWYATVPSGDYRVQYNTISLTTPYSGAYLRVNANGFYQYDSGPDTFFKRKVTLTKISNVEVKVEVEISWQSKGQPHSLIVEDRLWNWKDPY